MIKRRQRSLGQHQRGFLLIALVALLAIGGLYFFITNLSPEQFQARRQQLTGEALAQAREALIGYAVRFREDQLKTGTSGVVYGYLPLPDLGNTRNQNVGCTEEGCDAANFAGNALNVTVIGRFPWRTLGTGPLRDSDGECLWYAVSGSHQRIQQTSPMNWDTLSQLDVVVANSTAAMISAITSAHERPIAVIFSPGPPLAGQDRKASVTDSVAECGGNYLVSNYLDPVVATSLGGITNYLAGVNSASGDTSATNKALSANSVVNRRSDGTLWAGNCPPNDTSACTIAANDTGVAVTSELLFRTLRGSSYFRTDINAMLERMATCLRDQVAAGSGFTPDALTGFTPPADKTVGRIPASTCYDDTQNPLGYFGHYRDQVFIAKPTAGSWTVAVDGVNQTSCSAALLFGSQRGAGQSRSTTAERNTPANYLEGSNLTGFTSTGVPSFSGASLLAQVSATQTANQDIVRCIPAGASLAVAAPVVAAAAGNIQLAAYAPATGLLTLGSGATTSNYGSGSANLFACAWTPEAQAAGTGFRSYFRFRIRRVAEGFTFAVIDGDRNAANACGAARQQLGYSGDSGNALFPYIKPPKLAIEFDTSRQCNSPTFDASGRPACVFTEAGDTLSNGRNDPCYTTGCWTGSPLYPGTSQGLNNSSHVAIVYWGYGAALTLPLQDDNVHDQSGLPMPTDASSRPGPRNPAPVLPYVANPATIPGIAPLDRMGGTDASQREFHARIEVTRSFTAPADPKDGVTTVQVKFWIEPHTAASISAMTYNAGVPPTLTVSTSTAHSLATGDTVVIKDAVPLGYNGEYPVTVINATSFTATLPSGTANPGRYISAISWGDVSFGTDRATVTSANHGLNTGNIVTISGAIPPEYNGTRAITRIDANSYRFGLELDYEPGDMAPAIAAAKALTPRATALANTTRPMSELDATAKAFLSDTATIYDEQMSACAGSAPLCPSGQSCGSDNKCYRPSFRNLRLGFTTAERPTTSLTTARDQLIEIKDRVTTWLP
jgi:type II secretory pathway pseudopilin PulG